MNYKLIIFMLLISTNAYAGYFISHSGETITGKRASCGAACSNNPNMLRVSEAVYLVTNSQLDKIVNGTVVPKSQGELDAEAAARTQAVIDAEIARVAAIDSGLSNLGAVTGLTNFEAQIDSIGSFSELKIVLKKLARYIASK